MNLPNLLVPKNVPRNFLSLHPLPPHPSASVILSPILKYLLSFLRLPNRPVLFVMSIGNALSTAILKLPQFLRMTTVPVILTSKNNHPKRLSISLLENKRKQRYTAHNFGRKIVKHPTSNTLARPKSVHMSPILTPMPGFDPCVTCFFAGLTPPTGQLLLLSNFIPFL
jgi:hypothetical protein